MCYDETRVVLKTSSGVEGSDYIHANYVSGYSKPQAFVLTQGVLVRFMDWALYNSHIYCIRVSLSVVVFVWLPQVQRTRQ